MERPQPVRTRDIGARTGPPPRPRTEADLRFIRQRAVRWFSPGTLAGAGLRVLISSAFGAYLDKRELQASIGAEPLARGVDIPELWIDYVSDTGDGFDATYTIAWLVAQESLSAPGLPVPLPRGDVLVLGGDEVYPAGDAEEYENRFVGPYRASLPWTDGGSPEMYALGGNHDWYDGLTSFIRIFCQEKWLGGRKTRQTRSYFALQLPHRWWLWGIDIQFDAYIDEPQLRYFEKATKLMQPGDRVILATAKPSWVDLKADPGAFRNLAYVERRLIEPTGARLMLTVSGDSHHYAHYVAADGTHKVTAGGGGAFLHPTHDLDDDIEIQVDPADDRTRRPYALTACYPEKRASRRLAWGAIGLPLRNPSFMVVPAVLYALLGWSSQFSLRAFELPGPLEESAPAFGWLDLWLGLARNPISILLVLIALAAWIAFAKPPVKWAQNPQRLIAKVVMGSLHTALHLVAVVLVGLLAVRFADLLADRGWFTFWFLVGMGVFGGVAGGLITGGYLALCNVIPGLDAHGNETFSAQRLTGYKNFLRMRLDSHGVLHVYPFGVRRVLKNRQWRLDPDGPPGAPWIGPEDDPPRAHLIEPPFTVDGR
ncbi:MAG: metallophosphoesterase [Actinomycetota bacterium]|nr:metallophosphoesterase [Actinomycetota bacterium]